MLYRKLTMKPILALKTTSNHRTCFLGILRIHVSNQTYTVKNFENINNYYQRTNITKNPLELGTRLASNIHGTLPKPYWVALTDSSKRLNTF